MLQDDDIIIIKFDNDKSFTIKYKKFKQIEYFNNMILFNNMQNLIKYDIHGINFWIYYNKDNISYDIIKILYKYVCKKDVSNINLENIEELILCFDKYLIDFDPLLIKNDITSSYLDNININNPHIIEIFLKNDLLLSKYYDKFQSILNLLQDKINIHKINPKLFYDIKYDKILYLNEIGFNKKL